MRKIAFLILCALLLSNHSVADTSVRKIRTVKQECRSISNKLASVSNQECLAVGLKQSGGYSELGYPILVKEFSPENKRIPKGRILLVAGIHGDEYSAVSITFKWLTLIKEHHSDLFNWRIIPLMNPDGLLKKKSTRMNSNGVDLNRNFPTMNWENESKHYWNVKTKRNPRRFPGNTPLSEKETQWLYKEIKEYKPDVIVSVHAPYGVIDYDHGGTMVGPRKLGSLRLKLLGTFPGSLGNYGVNKLGIPVLTLELKHAGILPSAKKRKQLWQDLVQWLEYNLPYKEPTLKTP